MMIVEEKLAHLPKCFMSEKVLLLCIGPVFGLDYSVFRGLESS